MTSATEKTDDDKVGTVLADNERTLDELSDDAKLLARQRTLRDSCEDCELIAEYGSVLDDLHESQHELAGIDKEITRRESWIRQDTEKAEKSSATSDR